MAAPSPAAGRSTDRRLWLAAAVSLLLAVAAIVGAIRTASGEHRPAAVVRSYLEAIARADAPAALGLSVTPSPGASGSTEFLTSTVLAEQRSIAPLRSITIGTTRATGPGRAAVEASYQLDFAGAPVPVTERIAVEKQAGRWRLAAGSVRARFAVSGAPGRLTLAGRPMPASAQLFPGAVPVASDWAGIAVTNHPHTTLAGATAEVSVTAGLTASERDQLSAAVDTALQRCLRAAPAAAVDPRCPLPTTGRAVPASLRGQALQLVAATRPTITVDPAATGVIVVTANLVVQGECDFWDYDNIAHRQSGRFPVLLRAAVSMATPASVFWEPVA